MNNGRKGGCVCGCDKGIYPWSSVTQIFRNGHQSHDGDCQFWSEYVNLATRNPWLSSSSLIASLYQGNHDRNQKLRNIGWIISKKLKYRYNKYQFVQKAEKHMSLFTYQIVCFLIISFGWYTKATTFINNPSSNV